MEKTQQSRERQNDTPERASARKTFRQNRTAPLLSLSQLRTVSSQPDGWLSLPPSQLRLLAGLLGNSALEQMSGGGMPLALADAGVQQTAPPQSSPNEIVTATPLLGGAPEFLPASQLPQPSACHFTEE